MEPSFSGQTARATCHHCQFTFVASTIDNDNSIDTLKDKRLVCPNCGTSSDNHAVVAAPAQQVEVLLGSTPRRWSVVAFRKDPDGNTQTDQDEIGIKRIVGLPSERISFHRGNLYKQDSNGTSGQPARKLIRKTLSVQRAMAILVHDSKYSNQSDRWQEYDQPFDWLNESTTVTWNSFQPFLGYQSTNTQQEANGIEDFYSVNRGLSRQLHQMDELLVTVELADAESGTLGFQVNLRGRMYGIAVQLDSREVQFFDGRTGEIKSQWDIDWPVADPGEKLLAEFSSIDHQVVLAINGKEIWTERVVPGDGPVSKEPIQLGWSGEKSNLHRIRLFRDVYYFSGPLKLNRSGELQEMVLETGNGYLMLGDNVPVSFDSRQWQTPSVPASNILGSVQKK